MKSPIEKIRDILEEGKHGIENTKSCNEYIFPVFPDREEKACSVIHDFRKLIISLCKNDERFAMLDIESVNFDYLQYSVTSKELCDEAPEIAVQKKEYNNRKTIYYEYISKIHSLIRPREYK